MNQIFHRHATAAFAACATACSSALRGADPEARAGEESATTATPAGNDFAAQCARRPWWPDRDVPRGSAAGTCWTPSASTCCASWSSSPASATSNCGKWCTARKWAAFSAMATRCSARAQDRQHLPHHRQRPGRRVPRRPARGATGQRHFGGRDGLPGAQPRHGAPTAPTSWWPTPVTCISFTPDTLEQLSPSGTRQLFDAAFIKRAGAAPARRARRRWRTRVASSRQACRARRPGEELVHRRGADRRVATRPLPHALASGVQSHAGSIRPQGHS